MRKILLDLLISKKKIYNIYYKGNKKWKKGNKTLYSLYSFFFLKKKKEKKKKRVWRLERKKWKRIGEAREVRSPALNHTHRGPINLDLFSFSLISFSCSASLQRRWILNFLSGEFTCLGLKGEMMIPSHFRSHFWLICVAD